MTCLGCGEPRTIRAHLIPQVFVREVRGTGKRHAIGSPDLSSIEPSQNGRFDDALLCAACDNGLGRDEKYAYELLRGAREYARDVVRETFELYGVESERLLRFTLGIVWKYSQTKARYGRIKLGPYAKLLHEALFDGGELPVFVDAFLLKLHSGRTEPHFYRTPAVQKYEGINFVRFTVGGFVFMLKLDKRQVDRLPGNAWIRGNSRIVIPAIPFDEIFEGREQLASIGNAKLLSIFGMSDE